MEAGAVDVLATGVQRDERPLLERAFAPRHSVRCLGPLLTADTVPLAVGYEAVSTSANAMLDAPVLEALVRGGTRLITQRSTGYNNIDLDHAERLGLTVARVADYSPYAVAEFAWTLATALNRRVIRGVRRTRDFDYRLDGMLGRDLHGRSVGVIGTGRIGTAFAAIGRGFGMRLLGWTSPRTRSASDSAWSTWSSTGCAASRT
jgi:D-lactate dehydrogenase